MRDTGQERGGVVVLGDDWVVPAQADRALLDQRKKRGWISLNRSPLARKIITFNLVGLFVLLAGVLYLDPGRDSMLRQRASAFVSQAELIADVFEARLSATGAPTLSADQADDASQTMSGLDLPQGLQVVLFSANGDLVATSEGLVPRVILPENGAERSTIITDFLNTVVEGVLSTSARRQTDGNTAGTVAKVKELANVVAREGTILRSGADGNGKNVFTVVTPVEVNGTFAGAVGLISASGEVDEIIRAEREQVYQMFVVAILVSVGLSLVLASTIANPLSDLATAAEVGREKNARKLSPSRVRIPDLSGRPDEIGRLSGALRGMVTALYDRIDANEQFAADVAHEIKNPLASLRSAVGTLHLAKTDEQRKKLLDVIEHDVRRLDRLVSDISNASRLDSELVKEEEESFDLIKLVSNLSEYLGNEARSKGVDFISDLPADPIQIHGLEARLAQVFVNLITNAVSFCEDGDAVRIWARRRDNRVLVVVEDTGPGIPEQALNKIFNRFYSERPVGQFGNHSGLGLAISKQIVEAHGGVIWAENIRPTDADVTSDPLGARFVVGLPI
ncbi:MAG: sensor histidine kinase [Pseudomonadota bacterium]|jgi:two-component system sensor histidine kinase ChvG|nr:sensor histidine kinase [Pseudomonadota bacterium]